MGEVILGGEAVAAGVVTRHELRCSYDAIHRGVYVRKDAGVSFRDRAVAAWLASRRKGVVAGAAAAALHGAAWVDPAQPIEVAGVKCAPQQGLVFRTERIADDEISHLAGLPVTTRTRTAFDLGRRPNRYQSLARLDALMWNQHFSIDEVSLSRSGTRAPPEFASFGSCSRSSMQERPLHARAASGCACSTTVFPGR